MTSSLTDVVTPGYDSGSYRHEIPTSVTCHRKCNDDGASRSELVTRRSNQQTSKRRHKHPSQRQPSEPNNSVKARALSDDDDTGSVCSGVSSASGSSGGTSHRRSGRKLRCPVHGQKKRLESDQNLGDMSEKLTVCCCRSSSRKVSSVTRPEPEGGLLPSALLKSTMDEFERLIYGPSEPLFSDCEVTADDVLETIELRTSCDRQRKCRTDNETGDLTESLFNAAQMINTNTIMKMAVIQNELKNVRNVSLRRVGTASGLKILDFNLQLSAAGSCLSCLLMFPFQHTSHAYNIMRLCMWFLVFFKCQPC